jgi:diadenylate cyclase
VEPDCPIEGIEEVRGQPSDDDADPIGTGIAKPMAGAVSWRPRRRVRGTSKAVTLMPAPPRSESLLVALRLVAPGSQLREGVERILQARMGALIVVGAGPEVLSVCSGGFLLDAEFTPQRLSELAKMDGAIILTSDCCRIVRANVHLVPDPNIPTSETGTRHRTAERVARQIDVPVLTLSEDRSEVAIHVRGLKRAIEPTPRVLARADQALQILERYKTRLDTVSGSLSALEVEDLVTVRDVATVLQRAEMVRRIAEEIEGYVIELGADGRLVMLQLEEMVGGVEDDRRLVAKDYSVTAPDWELADAMARLAALDDETLLDLHEVASVLHLPSDASLETAVQPRGFRLLHKIPRLPEVVSDHVVERFASLQKIMRASETDLVQVEGVGDARARAIKDGLARLAETSILERYT